MCRGTIVLCLKEVVMTLEEAIKLEFTEWDADWKSLVHVWVSVYWTSCPKFWGFQHF